MKKMLFIMNPKAGRTTLKNSLVDVLEVFCNNDYDVRTYLTKSADDAERVPLREYPPLGDQIREEGCRRHNRRTPISQHAPHGENYLLLMVLPSPSL